MSDNVVKGLGHHGLWGFSPFFDLLEAIINTCDLNSSSSSSSSSEPINILLLHPGDIRHILFTISRNKRYLSYFNTRPIHFYLFDSSIEILARDLLLLEVFIDFEIPIRQRANIFLEIFGNAKVQERTARYIEQLGQKLISLAVNSIATLEIVDLQHLKYKDKDNLESVFKSYSRKYPCDMINLRDHRLRGYYAERYDSRRALGDWDWQYSYRETAASIIHITLYRDWRETGVAFEFGDQTYVEGNRTMLTYVEGTLKRGKDAGHNKEIKGFWSDITCSPYFSFGLEADSRSPPLSQKASEFTEGLFEILNKGTGTEQHRHHTVEVAVYNMFCMLWEIEMGVPYSLSRKNDIYSGLGEKDSGKQKQNDSDQNNTKDDSSEFVRVEEILDPIEENQEEEEKKEGEKEEGGDEEEKSNNNNNNPSTTTNTTTITTSNESEEEMLKQELKRAECIVETFRNIKIFPLVGSPNDVLKKSKFQNHFDCVFVSSRSAHFLQDPLVNEILRSSPNKSLVAVETSKYITALLRDQKKEFIEKEKEFGTLHNWTYLSTDPVPRRKRDENDTMKDTLFFLKT